MALVLSPALSFAELERKSSHGALHSLWTPEIRMAPKALSRQTQESYASDFLRYTPAELDYLTNLLDQYCGNDFIACTASLKELVPACQPKETPSAYTSLGELSAGEECQADYCEEMHMDVDISMPTYSENCPQECLESRDLPTLMSRRPISSDDELFLPGRPGTGPLLHKLGILCSVCRRPFETHDECALQSHLGKHMEGLMQGSTCDTCSIKFAFEKDLDYHMLHKASAHSGIQHRRGRSTVKTSAMVDSHSQVLLDCNNTLHWEQLQLRAHYKDIDMLASERSKRSRTSSVPATSREALTTKSRKALAPISGNERKPERRKPLVPLPVNASQRFKIWTAKIT